MPTIADGPLATGLARLLSAVTIFAAGVAVLVLGVAVLVLGVAVLVLGVAVLVLGVAVLVLGVAVLVLGVALLVAGVWRAVAGDRFALARRSLAIDTSRMPCDPSVRRAGPLESPRTCPKAGTALGVGVAAKFRRARKRTRPSRALTPRGFHADLRPTRICALKREARSAPPRACRGCGRSWRRSGPM
jgi:hypothetical protein